MHGANTLRSQADREEALGALCCAVVGLWLCCGGGGGVLLPCRVPFGLWPQAAVQGGDRLVPLVCHHPAAGKDLPVVAVGTLLPRAAPGGEGDEEGGLGGALVHPRNMTAQLLAANGFSPHRQARLKLIHAAACRLAWFGGGAPAPHTAAALAAVEGSKVFVVTAVPGSEPGSSSRLDIQQVDLSEDAAIAGWVPRLPVGCGCGGWGILLCVGCGCVVGASTSFWEWIVGGGGCCFTLRLACYDQSVARTNVWPPRWDC